MDKIIKDEFYEEGDLNHKMVIKLKMPKPPVIGTGTGTETKNGIEWSLQSEGKRVCVICNKEFNSGKALGGHMRIHLQSPNKNPSFLKPATNFNKTGFNGDCKTNKKKNELIKPCYMKSVNDEGKPTCSQCGKNFPSMKSLFGHMRCHPERVWRGIIPPPTTPDQVVDLTKFIRGWSVTERRGRKSLKPAEEDDSNLLEAVEDLMSLANAVVSTTDSNSGSKIEIEGKRDETEAKLGFEDMNEKMRDEQLSVNYKYKMKRRKKMKLMMELHEQKIEVECKYKCTICNKGFATHQALGGHRSSHNKSKLIEEDDHESLLTNDQYSSESFLLKEFEFKGVVFAPGTSSLHQCKVCDKVFATGQALGGHKRCHFGGISEAKAPSSQITSAGEGGSQTESGRKVLDFDLNEFPMSMMEEAANVNGNWYVSSSYNTYMGY
ncbi:hypothetical protein QVD17_13997 [Tagetes erecta]|uniref:C2H2-type domain-containing protein n=1 Tax=Tagetes erecta TaxID=13708 RepID=A0AAD8P3K3_TARER|nr:hypothetical protein QVD17_13997 [Tagetes erecta]